MRTRAFSCASAQAGVGGGPKAAFSEGLNTWEGTVPRPKKKCGKLLRNARTAILFTTQSLSPGPTRPHCEQEGLEGPPVPEAWSRREQLRLPHIPNSLPLGDKCPRFRSAFVVPGKARLILQPPAHSHGSIQLLAQSRLRSQTGPPRILGGPSSMGFASM